jgi:preprotein translocase subunit SecD
MMRLVSTLIASLVLSSPAFASRDFRIAGEAFAEAEILDARALASLGGEPAILITLTPKAAPRLLRLTKDAAGKTLIVTLDGQPLPGPTLSAPISDGALELPGIASFEEGEALAKAISGKPPVPDSLDEGP